MPALVNITTNVENVAEIQLVEDAMASRILDWYKFSFLLGDCFKEYDDCGNCGANNECIGCDGIAYSGLAYDTVLLVEYVATNTI